MEIKKENIEVKSYLIGLHSFRKDHNYGSFKENLKNDLQELFSYNFDTFKIGGYDILKSSENEAFEIRLTPSTIIYQDNLSFKKITSNAKDILDIWLIHSPKVKLSLIGLVTNFKIITNKSSIPQNQLHIKSQFFKEFKLGGKLKGVDFSFNYVVNYKSYEYNVSLSLIEKDGKNYSYFGSVDFNETTENKIGGLSINSCDRIFLAAKKYFENDIVKIINF